MRLSRAAVYAIRASLQLAEAPCGEPVPCRRLARVGEMPERFLLQVLRQMVNHGLLKSTRGVDGGYCLQRPANEISLLHVIEATDGPVTSDLPPMDGMPEWSQRRLIRVVQDMTRAVSEQLAKTSIADLCTVSVSPGSESPGMDSSEATEV